MNSQVIIKSKVAPINFSSLNLKDHFLKVEKKICSRYTKNYLKVLTKAIQWGLAKSDIAMMLRNRNYFSPPLYRNSKIFKIRIYFLLLQLQYWCFFDKDQTRKKIHGRLKFFLRKKSFSWNPSLVNKKIYNEAFAGMNQLSSKYSLELVVIPSPRGFNWDRPCSFFWSLKNYLFFNYNHKIGHGVVLLKKDNQVVAATGMTGETNWQSCLDMIFKGNGLDILFRSYLGRVECGFDILKDILKHQSKNHIQSKEFSIDFESFKLCLSHLSQWFENGWYQNYGLTYNVNDHSGASCVSYALNFLSIAGVLTLEHKQNWKRTVFISEEFIKSENNSVGLLKLMRLLFSKKNWSVENIPCRKLEFWDPDLIYHWIKGDKLNSTVVESSTVK